MIHTKVNSLELQTKKQDNNFVNDRLASKPIEVPLDITQVSWPTNKDKAYIHSTRIDRYADRDMAGKLLGGRQKDCGCKCIDKGGIAIMQKEDRTYFSGVSTCSSVWACPVCSNKINEARSKDVSLLLNYYLKAGFSLAMVTLTSQHNKNESCFKVKNKELGSFNKMIASRKYKDLCKQYNFEGYVRALEVTIGVNGWHPHIHLAIIANNTQEALNEFANSIIQLWVSFNKGTNAGAQDYTPILDVQGVSDYITKWGAADELVKSNHKTNKNKKGYPPFALLRLVKEQGEGAMIPNTDFNAAKAFKDYAKAFKGAKQLTYSKNFQVKLKELTTLKTDEEICTEKQEDAKPVLFLKNNLFKHIVKNKLQAYVLNIMESESILELELLLMEFGLFTTFDQDKKRLIFSREKIPGLKKYYKR